LRERIAYESIVEGIEVVKIEEPFLKDNFERECTGFGCGINNVFSGEAPQRES
jgi:hypothetical protein